MNLEIPLQQVPNQTFSVSLENSNYEITLNYRLNNMFISIVKDNEPVIYNRICQNLNPIDKFVFTDISGKENPVYTGFGERFKLVYSSEIVA